MRKFTFDLALVTEFPPIQEIRNAVLENNIEFTFSTDHQFIWPTIVECENQPSDMKTYGIIWIPLEKTNG